MNTNQISYLTGQHLKRKKINILTTYVKKNNYNGK